jgi:hypothetical protein
MIKLNWPKKGLIQKVLKTTGMTKADHKDSCSNDPLGSDLDGKTWTNYSSAIGQLLISRPTPDLTFSLQHNGARFSHSPKKSHGQAVKRICRYLAGTPNDGIKFSPNLSEGLNLCVWMLITPSSHGIKHPTHQVRTGFVQPILVVLSSGRVSFNRDLPQFNCIHVAFSMAMRDSSTMPSDLRDWTNLPIEDYQSKSSPINRLWRQPRLHLWSTSPRCPHATNIYR